MDQPVKSAVQLQEEQQGRHSALEKQRLKRSHEGGDDLDDDVYEDIAAPKGGFAARRRKQRKLDAASAATTGPSGQPWVSAMRLMWQWQDVEAILN